MSKVAVMSLSGGMDSTSLLMHLLAGDYDVKALSFNYGQKHFVELHRASKNIEYLKDNNIHVKHKIIDISDAMNVFYSALTDKRFDVQEGHYEQESMKDTVVPNRNMIFSSIVFGYAQSIVNKHGLNVTVSLGVHAGDHEIYPDCREVFFTKLFEAFKIGNWNSDKVNLYLPYLKNSKYDILCDAQSSIEALGLDFDTVFENTNTSYNPDIAGRSSGRSGADVERILAFNELGRKDPVQYLKPWDEVLNHALTVEKEFVK